MYKKQFLMDPLISTQNSNEYFNVISHLVGTILAIVGTTFLITSSASEFKWTHLAVFSVYGSTLILSCLSSTILHFFLLFKQYKRILGIIDHCAIYLLIAGSYVPFCLIVLGGRAGWWLLGIVWAITILFITLKVIFFSRIPANVSMASYIVLGWIVFPFIPEVIQVIGDTAALMLFFAGLFYSIGGLIMSQEKPDPWPPYFGSHEIWHVCVLVGHALMYAVMISYILPLNLR